MTTLIKIVLALLLLTATFQLGRAYVANYQFEDSVQQVLLFAPNASEDEISDQVMSLAAEYGLPLQAENITIREVASDRIVECTYTADVEFIPGMITRPLTFKPSTSVRLLNAPRRR